MVTAERRMPRQGTCKGPGPFLHIPRSARLARMVRLQKFLADAGIASRRAAEQIILAGRVAVNGQVIHELGTKVHPTRDQVSLDDRPIRPRRRLYVALHKPPGFICTRTDPEQRRTIDQLLPKEWQHLYSVGRLDRDSEGLIFLTNDGEFSLRLTHPRYGIRKIYEVTVLGRVEKTFLQRLVQGVTHEGERLKVDKARLLSSSNTRSVLELELTEGKNREIRRLLSALGFTITRLQRTRIGPIKLGELPPGKWRTLTEPEIKTLIPEL